MRWLRPCLILALVLVTVGAGLAFAAPAQAKSYSWDYIDVDIAIQTNGDLEIVETQRYVFSGGTFTYAYREIPLDRVESIDSVWVEDDSGLRARTSTRLESGRLRITWYFAPASGTRTFRLHYRARGALRIYAGGDQLWWKAVFAGRTGPVQAAHVTVHLPAAVPASELTVASYGVEAQHRLIGERTVWFSANALAPGQELEVRVQFPHGLVQAESPAWQAAADRQADYDARLRPTVNLLTAATSILFCLLGCLGVLLLWYLRGRERPASAWAEYLSEPPSDLPPALAGTLLRERPDVRDVLATIVDLARRGVLEIREQPGASLFQPDMPPDYTLRLLRQPPPLRPYEATLFGWLFVGSRERSLSELRERFDRALPEILSQVGAEAASCGLFEANPESVRLQYSLPGLLLAAVAAPVAALAAGALNGFPYPPLAALGLAVSEALRPYTDVGAWPFAGLAVVGAALAVAGKAMPRRTAGGAEQAARWRAFRRYLAQIDAYGGVAAAGEIFDRYLPYAIAFGLDRRWIAAFAAAGASAPSWYVPFGLGLAAGGLAGGLGDPSAGDIMPSLQNMSTGLAGSLQGMSAGLASMLDAAASTLSSGPAPSASAAGGGWSGGGAGAGGGGGGGSGGAG